MVNARGGLRIVYTDGSCLDCAFGGAADPAFEPDGTVISFAEGGRLLANGIDGVREGGRLPAGDDAVWAADGRVALVRHGDVFAGPPRRLAEIGRGSEPSWAPDGRSLAVARADGWIVLDALSRPGRARRLVRGSEPAFSPDGRRLAYIAPGGRVMVVRVDGPPRPRPVGTLRGVTVDWQPRVASAPACAVPPGSTVLASTRAALVTGDGPTSGFDFFSSPAVAYMGCLRADGRERLLEKFVGNNIDQATSVAAASVAAPYAALMQFFQDEHYGGQGDTVQVFDLATGRLMPGLGGETTGTCGFGYGGPCPSIDRLVVNSVGATAAHIEEQVPENGLATSITDVACAPASTTCVAVDGRDNLLASSNPGGGAGAWATVQSSSGAPLTAGLRAVACPSASLCVAVGGNAVYTSTNPTAPGSWTRATPTAGTVTPLFEVVCPSTSLCIGATVNGQVAATTDPAAGGSTWSGADIDGNTAIDALACASASLCFATDSARHVFATTNPAGGAGAWASSPGTPAFDAGSCPTPSLCVLVQGDPAYTASTGAPATGPWSQASVAPSDLHSVSCPTTTLCVGVGNGDAVSTNPAGGVWEPESIDALGTPSSVACPSASLCVAADSTGHILTSTDPAGGPAAWSSAFVDGDPCTAVSACSVEQILASSGHGVQTVDSFEAPGNGPFLTGLTLTGDTLGWSRDGTPESVVLAP